MTLRRRHRDINADVWFYTQPVKFILEIFISWLLKSLYIHATFIHFGGLNFHNEAINGKIKF